MSTCIKKGQKNSLNQRRDRDLDISIDQATRSCLLPYRMRHFDVPGPGAEFLLGRSERR